jgi:hypothetical protein
MKKWLRRILGAVGMGLTWAAGWALVDVWPTALAIPGFLGGAVFSAVLRIAEGRRRFDEVSLPRFGAWGAVIGLLLGVFAVSAGVASAIFPASGSPTAPRISAPPSGTRLRPSSTASVP